MQNAYVSRRTAIAGAGALVAAATLDLPGLGPVAQAQGTSVNQAPGFLPLQGRRHHADGRQ